MIGAQDLVSGATSIMGNGNDLTTATAPTIYNGQSSAIAKAAAINAIKTQSGVTATALANVVTGNAAVGAVTLASGDLWINGSNIGAVTVTASDGTGALVSAINSATADTGVTADTDSSGKLVLTAADGRNISVYTNATTDAEALFDNGSSGSTWVTSYFNNTSAVFRSSVQLNDDSNFDITGTLSDLYDNGTTAALNNTKTTDGSKSVASDLATYNVATMSISTQASAEAALLTIDAALDDVNGIRANIGAVQNRLEFTVANLEIAAENTAASQSRILDADFAFETAVFTRNQIMVQAATAMLAQANTLPQAALQLLG
jgi:flagellin